MSRETSGNRGYSRRRGWRAAGCALAVSLIGVFAAQALAASPKPGCWGTCGGDEGPVQGYFFVSGHKLRDGISAEFKCLGVQKIKFVGGQSVTVGDTLIVPHPRANRLAPALKISTSGHFSFRGKGVRTLSVGSGKWFNVEVDLSGEFISSTKALLTFHISYGKCGTQHLTVHAD